MLAGRIRDEMARPIVHAGSSYIISASIGMTFAIAGRHAEDVLRDADIAMYRAKGRGKNRVEVFDDLLRADLLERSRVESVLRAALEPGEGSPTLSVAYQPVHDLADGRLAGFEALARLNDDRGTPIRPDTFIAVAEDTGLIGALGEAVLEAALGALATWRRQHPHLRDVNIAVNLSARQIERSDMYKIVHEGLARHGLEPADLMIEITESVLLDAGSSTMRQVGELRASGVGIAIDDFGTGYASLRYLMNLPITTVKIDRSFTAGIPADATSATIVRTVAALAAELGLECVVEGIETRQQLESLPAGVLGQGYLLGRPAARLYQSWPGTATHPLGSVRDGRDVGVDVGELPRPDDHHEHDEGEGETTRDDGAHGDRVVAQDPDHR